MYSIYKATNKISKKSYIGVTKSYAVRKRVHKWAAMSQKAETIFARAIRKHGFDSFDWEILFEGWDKKFIYRYAEAHFIVEHKTHMSEYGYNMTYGGENGSFIGKPHSEETKEKLRQKALGRVMSQESKEKMSLTRLGKPSPNKGRKLSPESIEKMRRTKLGKPSPKKGTKVTNLETLRKLSEAAKVQARDPLTKRYVKTSNL